MRSVRKPFSATRAHEKNRDEFLARPVTRTATQPQPRLYALLQSKLQPRLHAKLLPELQPRPEGNNMHRYEEDTTGQYRDRDRN